MDEASCWICLEPDGSDLMIRACACRGSAGAVHAACVIELARRSERQADWLECPTCNQPYVGPLQSKLAEARWSLFQTGARADSYYGLCSQYTNSLVAEGRFDEALKVHDQTIEHAERCSDGSSDDRLHLANLRVDMAYVLAAKGRRSEALEEYRHALAVQEAILGSSHPTVSATCHNLGALYDDLAMYEKAQQYLSRAIDIDLKQNKHDTLGMAETFNTLGIVYRNLRHFDESHGMFDRALAVKVQLLGATHLDVAKIECNKAVVLRRQERFGEALALYECALRKMLDMLGPNHHEVQDVTMNIGLCRLHQTNPAAICVHSRQRTVCIQCGGVDVCGLHGPSCILQCKQ